MLLLSVCETTAFCECRQRSSQRLHRPCARCGRSVVPHMLHWSYAFAQRGGVFWSLDASEGLTGLWSELPWDSTATWRFSYWWQRSPTTWAIFCITSEVTTLPTPRRAMLFDVPTYSAHAHRSQARRRHIGAASISARGKCRRVLVALHRPSCAAARPRLLG